jgi:phosphatidylinositol alpha-1,6-mannosyltransferase
MPQAKVIVLTHEFSPFRGGAAIYAQEIAAAIQQLGREVELWAPDYGGRFGEDHYSFPVIRLRAGGSLGFFHMLEYTRALRSRVEDLSEATVIPVSVGVHMALMILSNLSRVRFGKIISVLHGSEVLRFRRNPFCHSLARSFYRSQVHRVATVSEFSKSLIERSNILPEKMPILIAPGAPSSAAKTETHAHPLRTEAVKILTLARVDPRKGQLDVARALGKLPPEMRGKILYQVAGRRDVSYFRAIERAWRNNDVPFVDLGEIAPEEVAATYQQCDIYAMTSRLLPRSVEGLGLTYLEAGFHGKPVIAYRSGGASEAVINNETGLVVAEGDLAALTEAFAQLIASPELRERLGEGGRRNAARYNWETSARILLDSVAS